MWRSYDPAVVREELARAARPRAERDPLVLLLARLHARARTARRDARSRTTPTSSTPTIELGMTHVPTFIVGHMSGENWDPAWRDGRDLYGDVWLVARQAWFVREMTAPLRRRTPPSPAGWSPTRCRSTAARRRRRRRSPRGRASSSHAVRAGGGTQPVSLGDGAWGVEVTGQRQRLLGATHRRRSSTSSGRTSTRWSDDLVRQHLRAAFVCELAGRLRQARSCSRSSASAPTSRRRRDAAALLPPGAAHHAAGRGDRLDRLEQHRLRRPASTRTPTATTRSSCTSASPTAHGRPKPPLRELRDVRRLLGAASACRGCERVARRRRAGRARALRARAALHRRRRTGATSATTCCRRTSPRARPTCRSRSCASATASPPAAAL